MHAVVPVQDSTDANNTYKFEDAARAFQNYEIYIGNHDTDYTQNQKCAGGPFLVIDNPSSFIYEDKAFDLGKDPFGMG